jgi:predicted ThiF/HesA family dinucleotide-utilizing enzyme
MVVSLTELDRRIRPREASYVCGVGILRIRIAEAQDLFHSCLCCVFAAAKKIMISSVLQEASERRCSQRQRF